MTTNVKKTVTDHALAMGFDLVRVTSAEEFVRDRDEAIKRIDEGLMDGLSWYHEGRVRAGSGPAEVIAWRALNHLLGIELLPRRLA